MDPLSLTASVIAVASVAAQISLVFAELRKHCIELPGRIHALNNEVADIEVVLHQVAAVLHDRSSLSASDQTAIPQLLKQAKTKLSELNEIVERLAATCDGKKVILRASAWRKEQPKLQTLQEDIKTVKSGLNIMLGASNSRDMIRVRLDLGTLSTATSPSAEDQTEIGDEAMQGIVRQQEGVVDLLRQNYQQVDQRLSRLQEMLNAQSAHIQANQSAKMGLLYSTSPPPPRRRRIRRSSKNSEPRSPVRSEGVGIRLNQYSRSVCRPGCSCACHTTQRSATPGLMDRLIGQLFVGYAGLPLLSPKCNSDTCSKTQSAHVTIEYWFPLGFCWSQIIRFQVGIRPHLGPQLYMSTLRRVPDSAPCVNFAVEGNIEGLKSLFKHGLASARDVSSTRGYSVLRWALYGQQYDTCKFLMSAGADPDYPVLILLLDRWFEDSECPRLKGPHLLEFVAQYADAKTILLLASASHLKLKYDKDYVLDHVKHRLHKRVNVTDEPVAAFEELLDVVKQGPELPHGAEALMEAGLPARQESRSEKDEGDGSDNDDDESDDDFMDAEESFSLASHDIDIGDLAARLKKRATV